ncbi:unnamed protein product [Bursaphelenchus xylophilus]|nr:unnamed protein product [Bursaphelenchus xylophilus]CAG9096979.1 unnamed protein product [Bursaphelenchus xylophilus]
MGACGATVPLREVENEVEYDTIYNTNFSQPMELGVMDKGILCYIWPKEYHNINTKRHGKMDHQQTREEINMTPIPNMNDQECTLPPVDNGEWLINGLKALPGTSASLFCIPGFTPSNISTVIVCQETSQWEPFPAVCSRRNCSRFDEEQLKGKIRYNVPIVALTPLDEDQYPIGTKATLQCKSETQSVDGVDTVICGDQGWIPNRLGVCAKVCPPFVLNHGRVRYTDIRGYERKAYSNGTVATAICDSGTRLQGVGAASCENGEWSNGHLGSCEPIQCLRMDNIRKGTVQYSKTKKNLKEFSEGDVAKLICNNGTQLKGASESVCEPDGVWKPKLGTCE